MIYNDRITSRKVNVHDRNLMAAHLQTSVCEGQHVDRNEIYNLVDQITEAELDTSSVDTITNSSAARFRNKFYS